MIDWTYIILVLPAIIFSMIASSRVTRTFDKYSTQLSMRRITGAQAARAVLNANGLSAVAVERVAGKLSDHFDPSANVVRLSESVYDSASTAAIGVACHEVGHAIQHAVGYAPVKLRTAIVPITNFGAKLSTPLIIGGLLLASFAPSLIWLAYAGIACFALCTVFQLVTLPTEFNASRRALESMQSCGVLYDSEVDSARKVLRAAAMTYVAALAVSFMQLLRFILIVRRRR